MFVLTFRVCATCLVVVGWVFALGVACVICGLRFVIVCSFSFWVFFELVALFELFGLCMAL